MYNFRRSATTSLRKTWSLAPFSSLSNEKSAAEYIANRDLFGANGTSLLVRGNCTGGYMVNFRSRYKLIENHVANARTRCARSFVDRNHEFLFSMKNQHSNLGEKVSLIFLTYPLTLVRPGKDISTVEDPFDAPTYNIPEKPVTFAEGASYSVIILAGLGAAATYAVFKELIFEPTKRVNFYIRGPHRVGKVFAEMFEDQKDKQRKFTFLIY